MLVIAKPTNKYLILIFFRDLQKFINERLPRNPIVLNIPKLYHGFSNTSSTEEKLPNLLAGPMQFSQRDQSVLVIEDLTERGFASKDWFKYKLNHQEVLLGEVEVYPKKTRQNKYFCSFLTLFLNFGFPIFLAPEYTSSSRI